MSNSHRIEVHRPAEIRASANQVWCLLSDWAGMMRWWPAADQGGLRGPTLVRCDLVGEPGAVPRTRRMTLDNGVVAGEQIFYQNDETRRIRYRKSEPAGSDVSGYVASAYVDEIDAGRCTMYISSCFDLRSSADAAAAAARFESICQAIFNGFQNYFSRAVS